ncbi:uncharacterized protein LOC132188085 [Corylus avellana]|uniref:uncharacterized protein LOC132188084 n=1 Tax=Corylus avellana TaxID=13451 RepID=UPI00286A9729|nr:uncharacterized protein LOC132188084 [Corylus avellana]XP_059458479.1 uncharacterized protein LOC132188085 [Corylus avellana]
MNTMNSELRYVDYRPRDIKASSSSEGGYMKGLITYMVMDDLDIKPISMSTISAISLLIKFNVKDVGAVEEKVVDFGIDEGVKLLKASMQSKTVLTDVFLQAETAGFGTLISRCKNCMETMELFIHKIIRGITILFAISFLIAFIGNEDCMRRCLDEHKFKLKFQKPM